MSRIATDWRLLRTRVLEHKAQLRLSLRVTIAAVLSFMLFPLPVWTVLTAVILTQASFGGSLKATMDYFAGTLGGAVYAGAVAALVPHPNAIALGGVLAIAVAPLALLGAINRSFSASTVTGVLVLLVPGIAHAGPIEFAFYRVIEVAVGGITALAVSLLVLPARAHSLTIEAATKDYFGQGDECHMAFHFPLMPRIATQSDPPPWHTPAPEPMREYITLVTRHMIVDAIRSSENAFMNDVLPSYLMKRRWFSAKDHAIRSARIRYLVPLPDNRREVLLARDASRRQRPPLAAPIICHVG